MSSLICPVINHSAVTFPTPPPLPIPILFNPQLKNKFLTSGTSPKRVLVSGVKDSGPAKNFLIPTFSRTGNLIIDASKYGQNDQSFQEILQMKSHLALYWSYQTLGLICLQIFQLTIYQHLL